MKSAHSAKGDMMKPAMATEWIAEYKTAAVAICQCLHAYQGYLSPATIDRVVFHNMADEEALKSLLTAMSIQGLIVVISNGCYKLALRGQSYMDREGRG
jgi:multisubunit Na+/H+ antiporter MnhF subunit